MSAESSLSLDSPHDLPPRTWRGWWLAWPKWLRIGFWAAIGVALLHVALAIRMAIGLIEHPDITQFRQRGGEVFYSWSPRHASEIFPGYELIKAGFWGRSLSNVTEIGFTGATDTDLKFLCSRFPNTQVMFLQEAELTATGLAELSGLQKMRYLIIMNSEFDDRDLEQLHPPPSLKILTLRETKITNAAIPILQRIESLEIVDLLYTDVSLEAIVEWRKTSKIRIDTDKEFFPIDSLCGAFRWSDGLWTRDFEGTALITIDGPLSTPASQRTTKPLPRQHTSTLINWPAATLAQFQDGNYRFVLTLGEYESDPVNIHFENGKPSLYRFEFRMPVTKKQALGQSK